jgi:signal transduction histidine kinase
MSTTRDSQLARSDSTSPPAGRAVVAAVVAAMTVLMSLQLVGVVADDTAAAVVAVDATIAVMCLSLLPALWSRPATMAVTLGLLAALATTATPPATMAAFHVARWRDFRTAALASAVGMGAHLVRGWWWPIEGLPFGWYCLLVVIAYATLVGWGAYAQARRQLLESLAERLRRAEAEQGERVAEGLRRERSRLSREMHDVLAHRLSLLATYAGALEYRPDSSPERLAEAAGVIRGGIHEALEELREVITLLREDDSAAASSLRPPPGLLELSALVEECRAAGMVVAVNTTGQDSALAAAHGVPLSIGRAAYRVVQEGLTNARRHAPGSETAILLRRGAASLDVEVANPLDGGTRTHHVVPGHGLTGLRERVELAGGVLRADIDGGRYRLRAGFRWAA